jgi:hypothetical protein
MGIDNFVIPPTFIAPEPVSSVVVFIVLILCFASIIGTHYCHFAPSYLLRTLYIHKTSAHSWHRWRDYHLNTILPLCRYISRRLLCRRIHLLVHTNYSFTCLPLVVCITVLDLLHTLVNQVQQNAVIFRFIKEW